LDQYLETELQITQYYSNTYAYESEPILDMLCARGNRWRYTELIEETSGGRRHNRTFPRLFRIKPTLTARGGRQMADDTDSGLPVHQLLIPSDAIQFSHALASEVDCASVLQ
jgi:hypothetical protein